MRHPYDNKPRLGTGFTLWFIFCAAAGLGLLGVITWAVITLVTHFTR